MFHVYRNLNRGKSFSVKHKGHVIDYIEHTGFLFDVDFYVSKPGRKRAQVTKERNVHAYAKCFSYVSINDRKLREMVANLAVDRLDNSQITYRPFDSSVPDRFFTVNDQQPIDQSRLVFIKDGRIYNNDSIQTYEKIRIYWEGKNLIRST